MLWHCLRRAEASVWAMAAFKMSQMFFLTATGPRQAHPDGPDVSSFTLSLCPDTIIRISTFWGALFPGGGGAPGCPPEVASES